MPVDPAGGAGKTGLEGAVQVTHRLPVRFQVGCRLQVDSGVPVGVGKGRHERGERGLARGAGHRCGSDIDGVGTGRGCRQQRRQLPTGGVVGVDVHGQVEAVAQRRDEPGCRRGPQQPCHVFDREDVRAGGDDLIGKPQVVVEGVEVLAGAEQVAGVAHGDLRDGGAGGQHAVDRGTHLGDVVERVEDAEDVDATGCGLGDERVGDLRRVRRVSHRVAPAQQHLDRDVRQGFPKAVQPLPRVFTEEAQRHVVGGPAPRLDREQLGRKPSDVGRYSDQILRAHARGKQRLVRIAEGRLGDGERSLFAQRAGESFRAKLEQTLARARGRLLGQIGGGKLESGGDRQRVVAVGAVDGDVDQPVQHLRAAVLGLPPAQQLGPLVDERRRQVADEESRVFEHSLQEWDVGRDPADAELGKRTPGPQHGGAEVAPAAGEFCEHRVEVRADLGSCRGRAPIEPDAGTARRPVGRDLAGVGTEPLSGIFGRDAALQCGTSKSDVLLLKSQLLEARTRGDQHLRLDEVDIRDLFGDGVLDLDAGVHLDEHDLAGAGARGFEEEFDGARVLVADRLGKCHGVAVQVIANRRVEVRRRRDLDHLLVATLHRAVTLEQVNGVAGAVGEDLHLDVPRALHCLLEEHSRVTERAARLAHRLGKSRRQLIRGLDPAHAAPATAGDRLDEDGEADLGRLRHERVDIVRSIRRPQHRHPGTHGVLLGRDLVASHLEDRGGGPDEGDAGCCSFLGQFRVLGEEAVARVDGVGAALSGDADDLVDIQVGAHRMPRLADLVGLVGLQPVQRVAILVGIDSHGAGPEFEGRSEGSDRNLAAVCYQDLAEHHTSLLVTGPA